MDSSDGRCSSHTRQFGEAASQSDHESGTSRSSVGTISEQSFSYDSQTKKDNREVFEEWVLNGVNFDWPSEEGGPLCTIEDFLEQLVPSDASALPSDAAVEENTINLAKAIPVPRGPVNKKTYETIIALLNGCQEGFNPTKKIIFQDTHSQQFPDMTMHGNDFQPDILGAFPGLSVLPAQGSWSDVCIAIDVNLGPDTVNADEGKIYISAYHDECIARLLRAARNILSSSLCCYSFVATIFPDTQRMRIYRVDRSGSVSCAFNYMSKPYIVLVNPVHNIPNTIVGWDETIRIPTDTEVNEMQEVIDRVCPGLHANRSQSRWVKVRLNLALFESHIVGTKLPSEDECNCMSSPGEVLYGFSDQLAYTDDVIAGDSPDYYETDGFTFGSPLYMSSGIFSRATLVTRILVKVPKHGYHQLVLKDVWRDRDRTPEYMFYERILQYYSKLKKKAEFEWVRDLYGDVDEYHNWIPGLAEFYGCLDLSEVAHDRCGYTTITSRLRADVDISYERSRSRILLGPIGSKLEDYCGTDELVAAVKDAIIGHFIAVSCGVLHRDVSAGNILIASRHGHRQGFLHDFDYATFIPCDFQPSGRDSYENSEENSEEDGSEDMVGTFPFIAYDVLLKNTHMPHHDLESFYWVLLWILFRHPDHNNKHGVHARTKFFHRPVDTAIAGKIAWLAWRKPLMIGDDGPLNAALNNLYLVFLRTVPAFKGKTPTHSEIAGILHEVPFSPNS